MANIRNQYAILVGGAGTMAAIAVIRSLGRAGFEVHAVADSDNALGLHSNFAARTAVHPPSDTPGFQNWIASYIEQHRIAMIVPGGAINLGAHPVFQSYEHLFPHSQDAVVLEKAQKYGLFQFLTSSPSPVCEHLPPTLLLDLDSATLDRSSIESFDLPLFLKVDGANSTNGAPDRVIKLRDHGALSTSLAELSASYRRAVLQAYVPGFGVGVFLLRWAGRIQAVFMHRRLHEMPHTGGASSFRESWWNESIASDAQSKLSAIGWEGVAMIEYRYDPASARFFLMEMNLRFWGSLHLALYSGVDFPLILAECFLGLRDQRAEIERKQDSHPVRCRNTIPFEVGYLVSLLRDPDVPRTRKLVALVEAVQLTLNPAVRNDLLFPGDRRLFWIRLKRFLITGN
jgi:predicted ATP-grasp superfamily ATP-dependent carboligase